MAKFKLNPDFLEVFPKAKIGLVIMRGMDNRIQNPDFYLPMLEEAQLSAKKYLTDEEFSNNEVIKVWREAFKLFKTKKGVRSSIEALLKRASAGNPVGAINPLVDIYNAVSMAYALPCGGEDLAKIVGDIHLTKADGSEEFVTYGSNESSPPYEGEIVYKDEAGAICRCFNWREAVRTMLTEDTRDAVLVIENVDPTRDEDFRAALNRLQGDIEKHLGGKGVQKILDIYTPETEL